MRIIDAYLNKTPAADLFHYTDANGLMGLFESGHIWATSAYHMNDSREFRYAIQLIRERIALRLRDNKGPMETYRVMEEQFEAMPNQIQVFIASFTEQGDVLSQWLAYSGSVNGYSIGFSSSHFDAARTAGFELVACTYTRDTHIELADAVIDELAGDPGVLTGDVDMQMFRRLILAAATMKHSGFERESEWRLVRMDPFAFGPISNLAFRKGRNGIVPYVRAPLVEAKAQFIPASVHIGPNDDMESARVAIEVFLCSYGANKFLSKLGVQVIVSNTPFRP